MGQGWNVPCLSQQCPSSPHPTPPWPQRVCIGKNLDARQPLSWFHDSWRFFKNCNWFLRTNKIGLRQLWQKRLRSSRPMSKAPCSAGNGPESLWWLQTGLGTKTRVKSILSGSWQGLPSETGEHRCTDLALSCGEWKYIFNQHYSIEEVWHVCLLWAVAAGGRLAACHPSTGSKKKKKNSILSWKKKKRQNNSSSHFLSTYMLGGGCFAWIITSLLLSPLWRFYNYPWGEQGSEGEITSPSSRGCGGIPIWNPRSVLLRSASVPCEPARMSWAPQKSLIDIRGS